MSKPFWSLLNKKQVKHLKEMGVRNVETFLKCRETQIKHDANKENTISCWECRQIARATGHK